MGITDVSILRAQFFNCRQEPNQSLSTFSLRLHELFSRLKQKHPTGLEAGDSLLKVQFVMGLKEGPIRQELRRKRPCITFNELQLEASALEEEQEEQWTPSGCLAVSKQTPAATQPEKKNWVTVGPSQPIPHTHSASRGRDWVYKPRAPPNSRYFQDSFTNLNKAEWHSKLDLASGYWQVEVEESDKKRLCSQHHSSYSSLKECRSAWNAPATLQRLMQRCLGELLTKSVLVYLN